MYFLFSTIRRIFTFNSSKCWNFVVWTVSFKTPPHIQWRVDKSRISADDCSPVTASEGNLAWTKAPPVKYCWQKQHSCSPLSQLRYASILTVVFIHIGIKIGLSETRLNIDNQSPGVLQIDTARKMEPCFVTHKILSRLLRKPVADVKMYLLVIFLQLFSRCLHNMVYSWKNEICCDTMCHHHFVVITFVHSLMNFQKSCLVYQYKVV